jgi:hypothetical protein
MAMTDVRRTPAHLLLASMVPVLVNPVAAMERLDDAALSQIQGQSGIITTMARVCTWKGFAWGPPGAMSLEHFIGSKWTLAPMHH